HAQPIPLQSLDALGRFQYPSTAKAHARRLRPVHLDDQRRRRSCDDRAPAQPDNMSAKANGDAIAVDLAQLGAPDDEPTRAASLDERWPALVAEPDAGGSHRRQQPSLLEPRRADLRDLAAGPMQGLILVEDDPRRRGEPPESVAGSDHGAQTEGRLDPAHPL